jgi:Family of unknown function (DUF6364)
MKNITLAIEEDVLSEVRRYAAARNTTVNALVRDYLAALAQDADRIAKARARLLQLSEESRGEIGPVKWSRDELYDR